MENNIPRDKNSMSGKIIELITFDITWVAKEDTFSCPWGEFVSMMSNSRGKTQAAKDFKVIIDRRLMK